MFGTVSREEFNKLQEKVRKLNQKIDELKDGQQFTVYEDIDRYLPRISNCYLNSTTIRVKDAVQELVEKAGFKFTYQEGVAEKVLIEKKPRSK